METFSVRDELRIEQIFDKLISLQSDTGTGMENQISSYIYNHLKELIYFQKNENLVGHIAIKDDPFQRSIVWGLVKGKGKKTAVLMNHHDAVDLTPYSEMANVALEPSLLRHKLKSIVTQREVLEDLGDSDWIFGRGTADMKSGVAMQLWALEKMSLEESLEGNILFLSVGDEENLSAGMRFAVPMLNQLADRFNLELTLAVNSEPYDIDDEENPVFYEGSVGKVMPVIYARGKTSHIGQVYSGLNPTFLLSQLQLLIEMNPEFTDCVEGELSAPPTWVYFRDGKDMYDASLPESAVAYFSVLTMTSTPSEIFEKVIGLSNQAFDTCIERINQSYVQTNKNSNYYLEPPELEPRVWSFSSLVDHIKAVDTNAFNIYKNESEKHIKRDLDQGKINLQEATIKLIDKLIQLLPDKEPIIVVAYGGPYYPHVCNLDLDIEESMDFSGLISTFSRDKWGIDFNRRHYFLGISDFSYTSFMMGAEEIDLIESNMPGWGELYYIPLDELKKFRMQLVNIGPRGKDIHKMTERVSRNDAFNRMPQLMMHLLETKFCSK